MNGVRTLDAGVVICLLVFKSHHVCERSNDLSDTFCFTIPGPSLVLTNSVSIPAPQNRHYIDGGFNPR